MEKETSSQKTLGQAIDEIIQALRSLQQNEQATAIRAACEHLRISPPANLGAVAGTGSPAPPSLGVARPVQVDIRTLKQEKQPASANEMAVLVAYYLSELAPEVERKTEVQVEDMVKYFKQASFPLPKKPQFLLVNARNAGYFDTIGSGKYRLNPVGYNLVAHGLPRPKPAAGPAFRSARGGGSRTGAQGKAKKG
jgi:hypothetical protein